MWCLKLKLPTDVVSPERVEAGEIYLDQSENNYDTKNGAFVFYSKEDAELQCEETEEVVKYDGVLYCVKLNEKFNWNAYCDEYYEEKEVKDAINEGNLFVNRAQDAYTTLDQCFVTSSREEAENLCNPWETAVIHKS